MTPQTQRFQERHQDYVWTFPTLQPGQPQTIPFRFDIDAPFSLRSLAARIPYDAAGTQTALASVSLAWSGPTQDYRQQLVRPVGVGLVPVGLRFLRWRASQTRMLKYWSGFVGSFPTRGALG